MSTKKTQRRLNLIKEGYIYTSSDDLLNESFVAGMMLSTMVLIMIGSISLNRKDALERKERLAKEKLDADQKQKLRDEYLKTTSKEKTLENMKADVKKIVNELNSNPSVKKQIEDSFKSHKGYLSSKDYKLVFQDNGDYIEIVDAEQDVREILSWIIYDINETLHLKYAEAIKLGIVTISEGDGDEGCLYIE
jgi:hypothetical protein